MKPTWCLTPGIVGSADVVSLTSAPASRGFFIPINNDIASHRGKPEKRPGTMTKTGLPALYFNRSAEEVAAFCKRLVNLAEGY